MRETIAEYKRHWGESPFLLAQGLVIEEVAVGRVTIRLPQATDVQRGGGNGLPHVLNGGVIAYMLDGALGKSLLSAMLELPEAQDIDPNDIGHFTLNLDITYLEAATGDSFEAQGSTVRVSRSTGFAEGRFVDANGKLCATAKGIWRVFWPRAAAV